MDNNSADNIRLLAREATQTPLTKEEQTLIKMLKAVPADTIIGWTISRVVHSKTGATGHELRTQLKEKRLLISHLKDQLRDCPAEVMKVIGRDAAELLNSLQ
jgi:hypothetical protein